MKERLEEQNIFKSQFGAFASRLGAEAAIDAAKIAASEAFETERLIFV